MGQFRARHWFARSVSMDEFQGVPLLCPVMRRRSIPSAATCMAQLIGPTVWAER